MAKTELTKEIEKALFKLVVPKAQGTYGCPECTLGAGYGNERVDLMTMDSSNCFRCYEIKVSVADLNSDAKLSFYGDYNYLVVSENVLEAAKEKFKPYTDIGIYCYRNINGYWHIVNEQKAKKKNVRIGTRIQLMHDMIRSMGRWPWKEMFEWKE